MTFVLRSPPNALDIVERFDLFQVISMENMVYGASQLVASLFNDLIRVSSLNKTVFVSSVPQQAQTCKDHPAVKKGHGQGAGVG